LGSYIDDLRYRVILYATTDKILEKGDLSILNFPVFIDSDVSLGNYEFNFSNVIITNINNIDISSLSIEKGQLTLVTDDSLNTDDEVLDNSISLFPNPVLNILSIESKASPILKVQFYSIVGEKVKEIRSNFNSIFTNDLSKGIYILQIYSDKGITNKKLMKN